MASRCRKSTSVNDLWLNLSRATGIVATLLAVAALVWGFFFSARNFGDTYQPAWWLDLHNWLGGIALIFTAAHLITVYVTPDSGIGLIQIFIPNTALGQQWPITWGVIAAYLFAITVFTSWPKKRFRRWLWRTIHLTSVLGTTLALIHAYQLGPDTQYLAFRVAFVASIAFGLYAVFRRLVGIALKVSRAS